MEIEKEKDICIGILTGQSTAFNTVDPNQFLFVFWRSRDRNIDRESRCISVLGRSPLRSAWEIQKERRYVLCVVFLLYDNIIDRH